MGDGPQRRRGYLVHGPILTDTDTAAVGAVLAVAEINGDGFQDLLIGSSATGVSGEVYLWLDPISGTHLAMDGDARILGSGPEIGVDIDAAGDVDGDGMLDLLVGEPGHLGAGRATLLFGVP